MIWENVSFVRSRLKTKTMNNTSTSTSDQRLVEFKRIVEGYLLTAVCICGLMGNTLTCTILSNRSMRKSITNIYIFALSCASSFVLLGFLLTYGIRSTFKAENFYLMIFTRIFPIHITCILIQIYLTAAIAVDRFILICFPIKSRQWRSRPRALIVIGAICTFSIVYCIPFWFEFELIEKNQTKTIIVSKLGSSQLFRLLMRQYLYFIFVFLIPLTIILICKVLMIRELYSIRKRKRLLGNSAPQNRSSNEINFLLLSIVFLFLLTQLPYFVFNVLYTWFGPDLMINLLARQYLSISNLLSVINASSTFLLYAFFDKKFREVGAHVFFCHPLQAGNLYRRTATSRLFKSNFSSSNKQTTPTNHQHSVTLERLISQNVLPNYLWTHVDRENLFFLIRFYQD